ncbi:methyltransferase [Mycobacterium antarcticum]|uniref:class I SAM-dependent methyltransferase n=1 Tax=unclassified Mycolicibacterium TaxID=2636767 RepID=UPI00239EA3BE|nr:MULTISPECIES: class I SAM-dependent methyltransferase [unclassified Mycolicibacterium]GLP73103.1 methyltransferase [Mycolicibacterium sp. TUM20983]GLP78816.1 methyltransferase [Mycolicibacterium sp. TUM20984]
MLTVDFDKLGVGAGSSVIDVGCGAGRHSFEAFRRGADVVAFDQDVAELNNVDAILQAMQEQGEAPASAKAEAVKGDALDLPYDDGSFDFVIASEILEHVPADDRAIGELIRVLKPGGRLAVTVPRWLPEKVCWALSDEYHANEGGHIRIYRADELRDKITARGLQFDHRHHAHALHAPFWWLKCAVGVDKPDHPLVTAYHKMLVWDMMSRPWLTRNAESLLNPLIGKSVALYFEKPAT